MKPAPSVANSPPHGQEGKPTGTAADPARPHEYPRRALVCVVGLVPAVVTETMYALAVQQDPAFVPTEVHVITTAPGAQRVNDLLLARPHGRLHALVADYLPGHAVLFGPDQIHLIRDGERVLEDIESPADSTATADTVIDVLRELSADPCCAIHASIAGGRKSMGFYLGYAMSLLGRAQDRVSHVLVNPPFENHREFFYPPLHAVELTAGDEKFSTAQARVTLALVNVVRLFDGLGRRVTERGERYDALVQRAQLELQRPVLVLRPSACTVSLGTTTCTLEPVEMFWYLYLALRRQHGEHEDPLVQPGMVRVLQQASRNVGITDAGLRAVERRMPDVHVDAANVDADYLKPKISAINSKLEAAFGPDLARRARLVGPADRSRRDGQYGLINIDAGSIHVA